MVITKVTFLRCFFVESADFCSREPFLLSCKQKMTGDGGFSAEKPLTTSETIIRRAKPDPNTVSRAIPALPAAGGVPTPA